MIDLLTRQVMIDRYPKIQPRWLAWCAAEGVLPTDDGLRGFRFTAWISRCIKAFRAQEKMKPDQVLSDIHQAFFTEWLWEHGEEYVEADA